MLVTNSDEYTSIRCCHSNMNAHQHGCTCTHTCIHHLTHITGREMNLRFCPHTETQHISVTGAVTLLNLRCFQSGYQVSHSSPMCFAQSRLLKCVAQFMSPCNHFHCRYSMCVQRRQVSWPFYIWMDGLFSLICIELGSYLPPQLFLTRLQADGSLTFSVNHKYWIWMSFQSLT